MERPKILRRKPVDQTGARQHAEREADTVHQRRSISQALKDTFGDHVFDKAQSPSTKMAVALNAKSGTTYAGTVSKATVARRRAKNKAARIARRAHR